jgi:N-methylhydantoinase B
MNQAACDPVTLELIGCRLTAGAQQMAAALWKSSYSTVVREVLDYSTAIFDAAGRMVAQSAQLPFQMMTMSAPLRRLVDAGYNWRPGDVVLLNDPYACDAQHLPDFMTFRPVFQGGRLVAFAGAVAHMIDAGGGAPGSYLAHATEIYQEGLRIPPVKVVRGGERNAELLGLIALNVREPEKVLGDLAAMVACTALGERVVQELLDRHGPALLGHALETLLDASEAQLGGRLRAVPEGTYRSVDFVDDDGISDDPIRLELALTFQGGRAVADFTGSSPQVRGPVNATREMTLTSVCYTLMAALGEGVPKNDGCRRVVEVVVPPRTVLSAELPAPVASRVTTCHRVVDLVLQALAPAAPGRVMAGYYGVSSICNLGGHDPRTGRPWVHFEIEVGGWGGRPTGDGPDGFSAHLHNLANTPVEVVELSAPLRVERYEFRAGSGGRGEYRGGLGLRRDLRVLCDEASLNLLSDHCKFPPRGLSGGQDGTPGCYVLNPGTPAEMVLPNKVSNYRVRAGDVISMQTPGGGGHGEAVRRDPALDEHDRREGKVTE